MGVPKFFRWISERYPMIIQRHGSPPNVERYREHFGTNDDEGSTKDAAAGLPPALSPPDPLSMCGLPPLIDRLYIDMNGVIHGCSHTNNMEEDVSSDDEGEGLVSSITHEEIFRNVCYYLDRIVKDVAKPQELLYLAIDGVAPRAKLNQQRARRYRSGKEGEIEQTVYDAHVLSQQLKQQEEARQRGGGGGDDTAAVSGKKVDDSGGGEGVHEVEPGRFVGKFSTDSEGAATASKAAEASSSSSLSSSSEKELFHSNAITPGTPFFSEFTEHLEEFVQRKLDTDPAWQKLTVVFSGPNAPGEGEHKIMQFMREQQSQKGYDPNLRHCIMGQDGDLIMLGLVTHEPNLVLLREQVLFGKRRTKEESVMARHGVAVYTNNAKFEFLHMNILRDYLAFEFQTSNVAGDEKFSLERTIDDFVFMTFLVGNDFLPHMPALDIGDSAFDLIFHVYRGRREKWYQDRKKSGVAPHLTDSGNILSGKRLEEFFKALGSHEESYYEYKRDEDDPAALRKLEAKWGQEMTPSDEVLESKEEADRARFREVMKSALNGDSVGFEPVLSQPSSSHDSDEAVIEQMGNLLKHSVADTDADFNDQDVKGRYYSDKLGFSPYDAEKHLDLRKAYIAGLVWNLKYYYEGCVSWSWFYPYHYGPMLSDLVDVDAILEETAFENEMGSPLQPFQQLMACMPPSHANLLPEPYRPLMTSPDSPICDFYPPSFVVDMNGKRWPWEAVVLLPFIDADRLREAADSVDQKSLSPAEVARNELKDAVVLSRGEEVHKTPFSQSSWVYKEQHKAIFQPKLQSGVHVPLDGLPTLRDDLLRSVWRKNLRINVHGTRSQYKTSLLELENAMPEVMPIEVIARKLNGTTIHINYPHFVEAFVTAVSDDESVVRGEAAMRTWSQDEATSRQERCFKIFNNFTFGEKLPGTGGITMIGGLETMSNFTYLIHVRPFSGLEKLDDGTVAKTYADFEVEVPLFAASWGPQSFDPRTAKALDKLEKDPYRAAKYVLTNKPRQSKKGTMTKRSRGLRGRGLGGFTLDGQELVEKSLVSSRFCSTICSRVESSAPLFQHRRHVVPHKRRPSSVVAQARGRRGLPALLALSAMVFFTFKTTHADSGSLFNKGSFLDAFRAEKNKQVPGPRLFSEGRQAEPIELSSDRGTTTPPLLFAHGTTTLSFVYGDGIVAAVDSRASLGSFVGSKTTFKVLPINSHVVGTMAGGAADCSVLIRHVSIAAKYHELQHGFRMSVARASRLLSNILYENRALGLSVGTMIMGFDNRHDAPPQIFYLDNSGIRIEGDAFSVGSGSTYAQGILDTERHPNMTPDEAISLGIRAIRLATFRDAFSGGFINVFHITRDGWKHVYSEDLAQASHSADKA